MSAILDMPLAKFQTYFIESVPQYRALKLRAVGRGVGYLAYDMPYAESLVGDSATGEIHEFAITTLIDAVCATAVQTRLDRSFRTATLDLRVDFMRKSRRGMDISCEAECLRLNGDTAIVRAVAHEGDKGDPLAISTGSFAIIAVRPRS
jgi:acyl-coenzyme A thioesterase PaaI-like protein